MSIRGGSHEHTRRGFLGGAALAALVPLTAGCRGTARAVPRPNVLVIMADQLRWSALSLAGNRVIATPNLDRFAAGAVHFAEAICPTPLCGPSRAAMLTGRLAAVHDCQVNSGTEDVSGIRPSVSTYDELLVRAGYNAEYVGKWHTGAGHRACYAEGLPDFLELYNEEIGARHPRPPEFQGDDVRIDRFTHLAYRASAVDDQLRSGIEEGLWVPRHPEAGESYLPAEDSLTAWTAKRAIRFLESRPRGPFVLTCSFLAPHSPLIASPPYSRMFSPAAMPLPALDDEGSIVPREMRSVPSALSYDADGLGRYIALYYGLVAEIDHWTGELLAALERAGLAEDTLVVFTSDHGEMLGEHGMLAKGVYFEGALRVPFLVRGAYGATRPATSHSAVTGRDLFATVLDYAGIAVPDAATLAATSLRAELEGGEPGPELAFAELATNESKLFIARSREWKLVVSRLLPPVLHDLVNDPGEVQNLLARGGERAHVSRAKELFGEIVRYFRSHGEALVDQLPRIPG